jgi:hypothetical protein
MANECSSPATSTVLDFHGVVGIILGTFSERTITIDDVSGTDLAWWD